MLIHSLVFITTQTCNLNCKYCFLANSKINNNEFYLLEQKKINNSLQNKEYINNYLKALKKLNNSPLDIQSVQIWGQEPTINLELFFQNFDYLYEKFPNINKLILSTNGIQNTEKIIEAIKIMNSTVNKKFLFSLQFSFDGLEYTKINRGIDPNIILKNIKNFVQELNKIKLKEYFHINFHFHAVLGKNLLTSLQTQEDIENYWKEIKEIILEISNLNINPNVNCQKQIYPAIESPLNASTNEGILINNFLSRSLRSEHGVESIILLFENITKHFHFCEKNYNLKLNDLIQIIKNKENTKYLNLDVYESLSRSCGCGTQNAVLRMDYQGNLLYCQNAMFKKDLKEIINDEDDYFYSLIKHDRYINILTDSLEDINKYFNFYQELSTQGFGQNFTNTLSLMFWLADSNLISPIYIKNTEKLIQHAFICSSLQNCIHNNIIETGSVYGRSLGLIKTYCNGVLSLLDDFIVGNNTYKYISVSPTEGEKK